MKHLHLMAVVAGAICLSACGSDHGPIESRIPGKIEGTLATNPIPIVGSLHRVTSDTHTEIAQDLPNDLAGVMFGHGLVPSNFMPQRHVGGMVLGVGEDPDSYTVYGAWLDESMFAVRYQTTSGGDEAVFAQGYSIGSSADTNPDLLQGATWTGALIGTDLSPSGASYRQGTIVSGEATVELTSVGDDGLSASVFLTGIRKERSRETYPDWSWSDMEVTAGSFTDGDTLNAKFYGSDHNEVGGVFDIQPNMEHPDARIITGAFGARRE